MRKYCKAYYLRDLRKFSGWEERKNEDETELSDDDVAYVWDDFTVVRSPVIPDKGLIFDEDTPEWRQFCQEILKFEIPEDLRFAYQQDETQESVSDDAQEKKDEASV